MAKRSKASSDPRLRTLIAQSAARIMAEEGMRDFALAKQKAAVQHGVYDNKNLPGNDEIQAALEEFQRLFRSHCQPQFLQHLRQTALQAMKLLEAFQPCLVGPALDGSADEHTPVYLHLFVHTTEEVLIFLMEQQIPFEQGERRVQYANGRTEYLPKFSFIAGDTEVQLTVFPENSRKQAPLSPVDGRPQRRADQAQLERIMQEEN
jgi:hypothetical protein